MRRWWTQQNAVVERWSLHVVLAATVNLKAFGQSYKHFTSVNYDPMSNFLVRYASRVVMYDRRAVIRLATGLDQMNKIWVQINDALLLRILIGYSVFSTNQNA